MAAHNGYRNQPATSSTTPRGSTEDWTYYSTGGLGFTFEIGPNNFHPPFAETVAEYEGGAGDGRGQGRQPRGLLQGPREHRRHGPPLVISASAPEGACCG